MTKLYVVGIGPGAQEGMTFQAFSVLQKSEVLVGYPLYLDLVRPLFPDKEYLETPMRREAERCRMAMDCARSGKETALVCSGDAGVYGLASLALELSAQEEGIEVRVVPGVTAALSGAALLGAPLGHDFAVLSLSDALTPWERIEKRLRLAAEAGLCLALYNPASHARPDHLKRACDILLEVLDRDTACGLARKIGREGESSRTLPLWQLREAEADMFTTVFIGNSETRILDGHLVTPRGYRTERKGP